MVQEHVAALDSNTRVTSFTWDFRNPWPFNWALSFDDGYVLDMDIVNAPVNPCTFVRDPTDILTGSVSISEDIVGAHFLIW